MVLTSIKSIKIIHLNKKDNSNTATRWQWLCFVIFIGVILRLIGLDSQSLWLDEMTSIQVAQKPLNLILTGKVFDNHTPPLYYALLHFWALLVPLNPMWLRLFSVIFDFFNMLLLMFFCNCFISSKKTLIVLSAYALSPFMLYYAQEGRMYTLAVFFILAYILTFERLLFAKKNLVLWVILNGIILGLGVYTHYYIAFFAFGVISLGIYICRYSMKRISAVLSSSFLAVILFSPWIPAVLKLATSGGQTFRKYIFEVIPYTLFRFVVGYAVFPINMHTKEHFYLEVSKHLLQLILVFGSLLLLIYIFIKSDNKKKRLFFLYIGWIAIAPAVLGLIVSLKAPILSERYLIVSFPLFIFFLLGSISYSKNLQKFAVAFFFFLLIYGNIAYFFNPHFGKTQWRETAEYVKQTARVEDVVFLQPDYVASVFLYYFKGPQSVHSLSPKKVYKFPITTERYIKNMMMKYERVLFINTGPYHDQAYKKIFEKFAVKTSTKIFPLENGIICTIWELADNSTNR